MVLGFISNIIITRSLGVEGYGIYMLVITLVTLASQFGSFGLNSVNIHFVAKDSSLLHPLLNVSIFVSIVSSIFICLLILVFNYLKPDFFDLDEISILSSTLLIPFALVALMVKSLLVGLGKIGDDNRVTLFARVFTLSILAMGMFALGENYTVFSLDNLTLRLVLAWFAFFLNLLITIYLSMRITKFIKQEKGVIKGIIEKIYKVGFKAYLVCLLSYLVLKSDIFIVNYYLNREELGNYSLAVSFIDYIYVLPSVIGTIVFQRLSAEKSNTVKEDLISKVLKIFVPVFVLALVAFFFLSEYLISFVYGEEFLGSVKSIKILLVAVLFMGVQTIQVQFINSFGFPKQVIFYWTVALAINLFLNIQYIEEYGITAVAYSTCISYAFVCLMVFVHHRLMRLSKAQNS